MIERPIQLTMDQSFIIDREADNLSQSLRNRLDELHLLAEFNRMPDSKQRKSFLERNFRTLQETIEGLIAEWQQELRQRIYPVF